jgi:hypothetical protein
VHAPVERRLCEKFAHEPRLLNAILREHHLRRDPRRMRYTRLRPQVPGRPDFLMRGRVP